MSENRDPGRDPSSVYDDLHARIVSGELAPGSPLVEGTLATSYGLSRAPIREALIRLTYEGLVERHDRGQRVRVLRPEDVLDLYEVRIALEAAAARAAAERRTELDLARLRNGVDAMLELKGDAADQRARLAHSFHFTIWAAGHNQALIDTLTGVQKLVTGLSSTTLHYPDRWKTFLAESSELVDAIAARDTDRAGAAATAQMTSARDFRVKLYSSDLSAQDAFL
jgi:DNA-binding GntR family transcriptional regulator